MSGGARGSGPATVGANGDPEGRHQLVRFEVPLDARYVGLMRAVAATVLAAVPEVDDERLDDVRVAVSEACTLVGASEARRRAEDSLVLTCSVGDGDGVWIEIGSRCGPLGGAGPVVADEAEPSWGRQLLEALVDEVVVSGEDAPRSVRLVVRGTFRPPEDPTP